ncbi:MAG: Fimbrial protein precursor [Candidatus Omnitrophica bacterium ADurb.Bin314]|nr:MAG: Fimbrial protein precursor [Candidatus Omnitrophica bacterium ADurb.Bin314]
MNKKGFTLIEVLIVVVIIAILAALILPRMTAQTERAAIAEAQQMLGTLRRAQATYIDSTGALGVAINSNSDANLTKLGMRSIASTSFTYTCTDGGNCTATSKMTNTANSTITLAIDATGFGCSGKFTPVSGTDPSKGCMPS